MIFYEVGEKGQEVQHLDSGRCWQIVKLNIQFLSYIRHIWEGYAINNHFPSARYLGTRLFVNVVFLLNLERKIYLRIIFFRTVLPGRTFYDNGNAFYAVQ